MSNFFVVRDPTPDSMSGEVLMEFNVNDHARYVIGCGLETYQRENHAVHATREAAVADADARVAMAVTRLQALMGGPRPSTVALWAALRGRVSLSEVVDMVRQDLEAETVDAGEAQGLANRLMDAVAPSTGPKVSDDVRPKNDLKVGEWTLKWVQDRVKMKHHQALAKYLQYRTPGQAAEADAAGFTLEMILRTAFDVENGHTAVPQAAIKVYRNVDGAPLSAVIAVCQASHYGRLTHLETLAKAVVKKVPRESMDDETKLLVDEMTVRHVMET